MKGFTHNLEARCALVTGAGGGIGAGIARELALRGYRVHLLGRRLQPLLTVRDELGERCGLARPIVADVADIAALRSALKEIARLDLVVSNAAVIGPIAPFSSLDPAAWRDCILTNLVGTFNVASATLPLLMSGKQPTLINIGSDAADGGIQGWSAYSASKAGLSALSRSLDAEYRPHGLRVFEYRPARTETGMRRMIRAMDPSRRCEDVSLLGTPDEAARQIAWLDTAAADSLLGRIVTADIAAAALAAIALRASE